MGSSTRRASVMPKEGEGQQARHGLAVGLVNR